MSDLISRCELFNSLATIQAETANEMKGKIYEVIQSAPTIDRPKGEWTIHYDKVENGMGGTYRERRWYCSACGKWQTYGETDFCPNCGADMRGEDDETD